MNKGSSNCCVVFLVTALCLLTIIAIGRELFNIYFVLYICYSILTLWGTFKRCLTFLFFWCYCSMMTEMMVWIIGPKEEEAVVLSSVAEGVLTSKSQAAVRSGRMTNIKGMALWKMRKKQLRIMKKRTDAKRKR